MNIFYLCDRRACEHCSPECEHTIDVRHAKNFQMCGNDIREIGAEQIVCESEISVDGQVDLNELVEAIAKGARQGTGSW